MAHRLNQLRTSTLSTRKTRFSSFCAMPFVVLDDQLISSSITLTSSPRTPGKKLTKGDPIVTGIRLRPFLERYVFRSIELESLEFLFDRIAKQRWMRIQLFKSSRAMSFAHKIIDLNCLNSPIASVPRHAM